MPPLSPSPSTPPTSPPAPKDTTPPKNRILFTAIGIIIVIGIIYFAYGGVHINLGSKTTISTTTIPQNKTHITTYSQYNISSCTTISTPGVYRVVANINTAEVTSPCIEIKSSNVALYGNSNKIIGSGPFVEIPPFSYGVKIDNVSNVSVYNLYVAKFSYGFYLKETSDSVLNNVTVLNATVSGIYLYNSSNNNVEYSSSFGASSQQGGIGLLGGSNNLIKNDTIINNAYYGLNINSTGNTFLNDSVKFNPIDLSCGSYANFSNSNKFINNACVVNNYCNFAHCSTTNLPTSLNSVSLSGAVWTCGVINSPGDYNLQGSINILSYVNTSNPLSKDDACISINSPNVKLDCNNNTILNAWYGVIASGQYNTSITDCNFKNDTYGIYLANSFGNNVNGVSANKNTYAVYLSNESGGAVSNTIVNGGTYGVYMDSSTGMTFSNVNATGNLYGIYVNTGSINTYSGSNLESNTKGDLYCSAQSYNSSFNTFQNNVCGVSDCSWATCTTHIQPPLAAFPVYSCGANISTPGNYSVESVLLSNGGTCIKIKANNVVFNCNGKTMEGGGVGFSVQNQTNVTIENCNINGLTSAINATHTKFLYIEHDNILNATGGVSILNGNFSQVIGSTVGSFARYGFSLRNTNNSLVLNNSANSGLNTATGFMLVGDYKDIFKGNSANSNSGSGFTVNNSTQNIISNNSAFSNSVFDYYCTGASSGLYSNTGPTDQGITKKGCTWMVETNPSISPQCFSISSSSSILFQQDMLYTFGGTCYTVFNTNSTFANNTVIDCEGHTVMATNGGVFVNVQNSPNVRVENCYLLGFSKAVESTATYTNIYNNTITNSTYGIALNGTLYPTIQRNIITNTSSGIYAQNSKYGLIQNNSITRSNTSIELFQGSTFKVLNNTVGSSKIGLYLVNSQTNIVQNENLNGSLYGISCTQFASNVTSNMDFGNNFCSSNNNCLWMTSSHGCAP